MRNIRLIPLSDSSEDLIPEYATEYSACFDIYADIENREIKTYDRNNHRISFDIVGNKFLLNPGQRALIPTGFIFEIPKEYSMRLHSRSGLAWKNGICLMNGEGIIDSDYPNETFVMLLNASSEPFELSHGDRIAQGELVDLVECSFKVMSKDRKFGNTTTRKGGFGSTGSK